MPGLKEYITHMVDSSSEIWRILMVNADEEYYWITRQMLNSARGRKIELEWASTYQIGQQKLENHPYHAVLVDYDLGALTGIQWIRETAARGYPAPLILYTGRGSYEIDVEAMEAGASLYLTIGESTSQTLERFIRYAIERKRSEYALRYHAAQLANINDAVIASDAQYHMTAWNPAAERLYGWKAEEVFGKLGIDILQTIFPDSNKPAMLEMIKNAGQWRGEATQVKKDGTRFPLEINTIVMRDEHGQVSGYLSLNRDISERKQAEQALSDTLTDVVHERNRLLAVMESLPIGMAMYNAQGGVIQANRAFEDMWGSPRPPADSADDYDAFKAWWVDSGERVQPEEWASARAIHNGESVAGQYIRIQRFDGETAYIINSGVPIRDDQGRVIGCAVAIMDITEKTRLEHEQREHGLQMEIQHTLLEYRAKERQRLARDLHDGPLQDLSSLIFQVQFSKESIENPHIRNEMDSVLNGLRLTVQNLRGMISELRPPALIRFGVAKALKIQVEDFHKKHPNLTLETNICNDRDCLNEQVRLNLYRIAQEALLNLAKHALATGARVMFTCDESAAVLEIEDNGQGFPVSDDLTAYLRHDQYGLAGMHELAEATGGSLEVISSPGAGTRVRAKMPVG